MNSTAMLAILEVVGNALRNLGDEIQAIAGNAAEETAEPETAAAPAKPARKRSPKKAADPEPEVDEDQDDDEAEEPAPKPRGKAKKITLEQLQELAAQLLEAGQRKELKAILTEAGAKSLSTADEEAYPEILEALTEAVDELED